MEKMQQVVTVIDMLITNQILDKTEGGYDF
jgi:hypothetical protein